MGYTSNSAMSFQSIASSMHIRFLVVATILVSIWFFFTVDGPGHYHPNHERPPPPGRPHWGESDGEKPPPHSYGALKGEGTLDLLSMDQAKEYCAARRWEAYPHRDSHRKIYDLMLINTELEWLEIRMGQMDSQVDYFIIVESAKTFTDADKPLYVRESWDRFAKYHHKMILHTLEIDGVNFENTWARERFSRNAMYDQVIPRLTGEKTANQGDVILVSDVDEIPRPDALKALRNCDFPKEVTLHTKMFYYSFQWLKRGDWPHPQATFYNKEETVLPDDLRGSNGANLYNAGWHCSYCFSTVAEMATKINSFSHAELNKDEFKDPDKIVVRVRSGKDMFDRESEHFDRVEDNPDVPRFLVEHPREYAYLLDRDPKNANFKDYVPTV